MNIKIFVEGEDDKNFLNDYLIFLSLNRDEISIIQIEGWTNLHRTKNQFKSNTDSGGINLIIFDADNDFNLRSTEILGKKIELDIEFELFLFPNNDSNGCLEDIYFTILREAHLPILNCFDGFCHCVNGHSTHCKIPDKKAKVFALLDVLNQETKVAKRNFLADEIWNLNHPRLNDLSEFLIEKIGTLQPT